MNIEKKREHDRRWREKNREKIRKYYREWWARNRDRLRERKRAWREENRNKIREYYQKWYKIKKETLKLAAFKLLGRKCCKCGIDNYRILQVNHLDSCGPYRTGMRLYKEVLENPSRFNLMCAVCHLAYRLGPKYEISWEIRSKVSAWQKASGSTWEGRILK